MFYFDMETTTWIIGFESKALNMSPITKKQKPVL